jgi:hypothetical protein
MSAPVFEETAGATLNRKWLLEVDVSEDDTPEWEPLTNITDFKQTTPLTTQDVTDFESEGWKSTVGTALEWVVVAKVNRKVTAADSKKYPAAQEALLAASRKLGISNRVHVRTFELEPSGPRPKALEGYMTVQWEDDGGDYSAKSSATITLNGQGKPDEVTHPYAA